MQNSDEENFKEKYFKYKTKYLELKDLIEGGKLPKDKSKDKSKDSFTNKLGKIVNDECDYKFFDCMKHIISCNWDLAKSKCIKRR